MIVADFLGFLDRVSVLLKLRSNFHQKKVAVLREGRVGSVQRTLGRAMSLLLIEALKRES